VLAHYRFGADAALYWDAVDYLQPGHDAITRWGLLRTPAENFSPREWYYGLIQILPYLQPGAQVLETERQAGDDIGVLAVRTVDQRLAIFLVNQRDTAVDMQLDVTAVSDMTRTPLQVIRTDAAMTGAPDGTIQLADGAAHLALPARSLTTVLSQ
jgi:hypothetical protein